MDEVFKYMCVYYNFIIGKPRNEIKCTLPKNKNLDE